MQALGVTAPETWMIGDNLEWEIEVPQRLGGSCSAFRA
jgi:putative hydrolase of the HAD superfamily